MKPNLLADADDQLSDNQVKYFKFSIGKFSWNFEFNSILLWFSYDDSKKLMSVIKDASALSSSMRSAS